jgi:5,10-methylenetetrahydromethanopterin reductase
MTIEFHAGMLPNMPSHQCLDMGVKAEQLGFDGLWLADSHSVFRDAYALLAALSLKTSKLKLGTAVTLTGTRHPAVVANSWSTLDELSCGRGIMGIGIGESAVFNLGLKPEKLAVFEEKINVIRALIEGGTVEYGGKEIHSAWSNTKVPIIMACSGPRSLQLGGKIADGVLYQVGANPDFHRYALDNIRKGAEEAGRDFDDLKIYSRLACSISEDRQAARDAVKGYCSVAAGTTYKTVPEQYFSDSLYQQLKDFKDNYDYAEHGSNAAQHGKWLTDDIIDAVSVSGTPEEAIPRIQEIADMGIDGFVVPFAQQDPSPYLELFANKIIPSIKTK